MTIAQINSFSREEFVARLGRVYEDSPWVAERAWGLRPFVSLEQLRLAMSRQVEDATVAEQMELLRAHPDLGAQARMSDASVGEQSSAGLDRLTREEHDTFVTLNREYRSKFGFPFVYAVKGSNKHDIIEAMRRRLQSTTEAELIEALAQVDRIASFRLEDMILKEGEN